MLAWRHKIGPGFVILIAAACLFIAFILQILISVGLPDLRSIYFLTFTLSDLGQEIKVGLWTLCTNQFYSSFWMQDDGETCQGNSLGYHDSQYGDIAQQILIPGLTKALAIQPLSTALTGVAVVAAGLHLCTNFIFWPFLCALAALCAIVTFIIEIVLFSTARMRLNSNRMVEWFGSPISQSSFGAGIWLQLVAMCLVIFATSLDWTAFVRRRLHKTHSAGRLGKKAPSIYRASLVGSQHDDEKAARGLPYDMARSHSRASSGTTATAKGSVGGDSAGKGSNRSKIAAGAATATAAAAATPRSSSQPTPAPALKTYNKSRKSVPSMEMESLPSPGATGAAAGAASTSPETARRRQQHGRVDSDIVVDSDVVAAARSRRTSQPRMPSRSSTARSEEFVDAPAASDDDDDDDEEEQRRKAVGARYAKYNAPMDPKDDAVISPRKGSRQARYSARMAELDA